MIILYKLHTRTATFFKLPQRFSNFQFHTRRRGRLSKSSDIFKHQQRCSLVLHKLMVSMDIVDKMLEITKIFYVLFSAESTICYNRKQTKHAVVDVAVCWHFKLREKIFQMSSFSPKSGIREKLLPRSCSKQQIILKITLKAGYLFDNRPVDGLGCAHVGREDWKGSSKVFQSRDSHQYFLVNFSL